VKGNIFGSLFIAQSLFTLLWAGVFIALLSHRSAVHTILENQYVRYLGTISFTMYLIHIFVIKFVFSIFPQSHILGWMSGLLIVIVVSYLLEKAFQGLDEFRRTIS
jgi:peptidoglycan/LPS O-acetylase OafA/YrhL